MQQLFLSLTQNVVLILSFAFVFSQFLPRLNQLRPRQYALIMGAAFGVFGVANMMVTVTVATGVVVDIRGPVIVVAGALGGWIAAIAAALPIALYRIFVTGGIGTLSGVAGMGIMVLVGALWHQRRLPQTRVAWGILGLLSTTASVTSTALLLPRETFIVFFENFVPVALILNPLTTLLLAQLIQSEQERLRITEALRTSEQRFRAIFNQTFQFIGLMRPDGVLIEANDTALEFAGITEQDVVGKYFWQAHWWSLNEATQVQLKEAIARAAAGEFVRYRADVVGKAGRVLTIDFSLKPVTDQSGKVVLLIPEGRDITNEIAAEQRRVELAVAHEQTTMLRRFIQDSSHHLRTPITILQSSAYLFKRAIDDATAAAADMSMHLDARDTDAAMEKAALVETALNRAEAKLPNFQRSLDDLTKLVEDLLALVRLEHKDELRLVPDDLAIIVATEAARYTGLATEAGLDYRVETGAAPIHIKADSVELRIALQNLIENAIRYTPTGGTVTVKAGIVDDHAEIMVQDTGIGIAETDAAQVFGRFYRADNAQTRHPRGTGLGLAITQKIIDAHQGTIAIDSVPDVGTTFRIHLPLAAELLVVR